MININLNNELSRAVELMAKHQHKPIEQVVNEALAGALEDYQDIKDAEASLAQIEHGKEQTTPWEQVKSSLYDVED